MPMPRDEETTQSIEIDEDLPFQRKLWRVERAGWITMALLLCASMLGLCGSGPLGRAERGDGGGGLLVQYDRLTRHQTSTQLLVRVRRTRGQAIVRVALDRAFLDGVELERVLPEPEHVQASGEQVVFAFGNDVQAPQMTASFYLRPVDIGPRTTRVAVPGIARVQLTQWVFP
jgi:hypothetical protein